VSISAADWARILSLLDAALDVPPGEREAWLAAQAPLSPEQAALLRQLLAERGALEAGGFLDHIPALANPAAAPPSDLAQGRQIGPYRLIRELGQGGMASVWLAERADGAHQRQVALKLPYRGPREHRIEERFARERQILSTLTHPHIASVLDAGTDGTQPWLAMEYVSGETIVDWAGQRQLDIPQRLALFVQVLRAVQYAHARLVIHCDIKPGNVLVDADGQVKLLDFGVAKLLATDTVDPAALTVMGNRPLTPQYASPEQISGAPLGTSSDVYALGVLLYELLTGRLPYRLRRATPGALEEAVLSARIELPSAAVASAAARSALRGDVDTIVMHALDARPAERYGSVEAFADDIQRSLQTQPILARPATSWYRLGKLVRRNRLAFGAGAVVALALLGATAVSIWQARTAQREARRAEAVQTFLTETLSFNEPDKANGRELSARELLDLSAGQIEARFAADSDTLAMLQHTVGGIYVEMGEFEKAEPHLRRAISLYEAQGLRGTGRHIDAMFNLVEALSEMEQFEPMRVVALEAQREAHRTLGASHRWSARLFAELAWADYHLGKAASAIALGEQALALQEQLTGEASRDYLRIAGTMVNIYNGNGNVEQAFALQQRAVQLGPQSAGYSEGDRLMDRYNLARTRFAMGDFHGLEQELRALTPEMFRHYGERHDRSIVTAALFAQTLARVGRADEAESLQQANLQRVMSRDPPDEEQIALQQLTLALVLKFSGRYEAALEPARRGLATFDASYSSPTNYRERARTILGEILLGLGRREEGESALRAAISNFAALGDPDSPWGAEARMILAISQRDAAAAQPACRTIERSIGTSSPNSLRCRTIEAWLAALSAAPADHPAALARFISARDRLLPALAPGQLLRDELETMQAEASADARHKPRMVQLRLLH
jgi:eukaryotic-like serine/threonine-protein kinase